MTAKKFDKDLKDIIIKCVRMIAGEEGSSGVFPEADFEVELEAPRDRSHGDISTNAALRLSKNTRKPPMEYAKLLAEKINAELSRSELGAELEKAEAKQPGFINFWFSKSRLFGTLERILGKGSRYGSCGIGKKIKVNIEFVSANPTGPLTIAHGRQAAFGDTLANILEFTGYRVTREYYLNDEGTQMSLLGESIRARYLELFGAPAAFPEDGYKGPYITEIAAEVRSKYGARFVNKESPQFFVDFGCRRIIQDIKNDLKDFNVDFDVWYSQKKLNSSGRVRRALSFMSQKQLLYEKGGAKWFRSSRFGDDKDRVVVKSTGEYTYLAPDIAYHMDKFKRGFDSLIDIWGPDHHGYVPRIKAAVKALGHKEEALKVLLVQLSTLYKDGKAVQMSTRAGEFITLRDLISEVGSDVARFFFLRRKRDSHLDFDLVLAKKHSMDNPVYYIQYAHARICSILKYWKKTKKISFKVSFHEKYLGGADESGIIKLLGRFPVIVELCSKDLEVFPLISYLEEVASAFHSYYDKNRIVTDDARLTESRLFLCLSIRTVLANGLRLLGVTSPKSM